MLDPYKRILLSKKKGNQSTDSCCTWIQLKTYCAKWKKWDTKDHILYDSISMRYAEKAYLYRESRLIRLTGDRNASDYKWAQGIFLGDGNILKLDCVDGCTTVNLLKTTEL